MKKDHLTYSIISGISLAWNALRGYDFTMTSIRNAGYLAAIPIEVTDVIDEMPIWALAGWALGVWGAVAGSLLLLARSRFAVHAFAAALFGLGLSTAYRASTTFPPAMRAPGMLAMMVLIWAASLFFLWFAIRSRRVGTLR
jgi:hypothetical protein